MIHQVIPWSCFSPSLPRLIWIQKRRVVRETASPNEENWRFLSVQAIAQALRHVGGNKPRAARQLGISRTQLYSPLRKYGLQCACVIPYEIFSSRGTVELVPQREDLGVGRLACALRHSILTTSIRQQVPDSQ